MEGTQNNLIVGEIYSSDSFANSNSTIMEYLGEDDMGDLAFKFLIKGMKAFQMEMDKTIRFKKSPDLSFWHIPKEEGELRLIKVVVKPKTTKEVKIRCNVSTDIIKSEVTGEIHVYIDEDATDEEIKQAKEEAAMEWLFDNIEWGWEDVE